MTKGNMSLKKFNEIHNKILFYHDYGGLGDVIMHRMLFSEVKKIIPDAMIDFSCDVNFMDAIKDHPLINKIADTKKTDKSEYLVHYETSVWTSNKYENHFGKNCKANRADIWAYYCGFEIENHNMNFNLKPQLIDDYKRKIEKFCTNKGKPIVLLAPIASVKTKSLLPEQIDIIKNELKDCNLVAIHHEEIPYCKENNIQGIYNTTITDWIYYTAVSDYVISVDTSTFHLAGGLKKPLMGIFTFANGKTYGKHYDFILVQKHIDNGDWDCGPCYDYKSCPKTKDIIKPCLKEIKEYHLKEGLTKMFDHWKWGRISLETL
jgi:ADP-heptose:LPS heptosyltransferase